VEAIENIPGPVLIATDNDWDRPLGNIGDEFACKFLALIPGAVRLRPPFPANDWCSVSSLPQTSEWRVTS
jgi:hypothetical protein